MINSANYNYIEHIKTGSLDFGNYDAEITEKLIPPQLNLYLFFIYLNANIKTSCRDLI